MLRRGEKCIVYCIEAVAIALAALFSCVQTRFCIWVGIFFLWLVCFFLYAVADIMKWEACLSQI